MKTDWHELIQRYLAVLTTTEETDTLQDALKTDAELRALFLDYINLDVALGAVAGAAESADHRRVFVPQAKRQVRRLAWRPLAAAAACVALLIGVIVASRKPAGPRPDLAAVFASSENAIAHLPAPPMAPLPDWISPTAVMLNPSDFRPATF